MKILGLDIGGAHIKSAVVSVGKAARLGRRRAIPFEIFRHKNTLPASLAAIRKKARPDGVALTMTGELSDVFKDRREGVRWIVNTVLKAMRPVEVRVVNSDGRLVSSAAAINKPESVASANWAATVAWVSKWVENGIVVDIGSTTTDILPIVNGRPAVKGKTDLERLKSGELLYTGSLRTNAAVACPVIRLDGAKIPACPEHFAIVGDAHLFLGGITAKDYTSTTPDVRAKTKQAAGARLARLILSDVKTLGKQRVESIAKQVADAQVEKIARAVKRLIAERGPRRAPVIVIGPGRFYVKALGARLGAPFPDSVAGHPVELIDPAASAAALWNQ